MLTRCFSRNAGKQTMPSLIRVFAIHTKESYVLRYQVNAQLWLRSDWPGEQDDLSHRCAQSEND